MCEERGHQGSQDRCGGGSHDSCGCGGGGGCGCGGQGSHSFKRRYQTKADQITELEAYLSQLQAEVLGVQERLTDLRA